MMLREQSQVALDNVVVMASKSADLYESEADRVSNDTAALFRTLAARRRAVAEQLANVLRRSGELPGEPDRDRETLEEIMVRLKTIIASDEEAELLQIREEGENELAAAVDRALNYQLPEKASSLLGPFVRHIAKTKTCLQQLRKA